MAHDVYPAPPEMAVGLAIDSFIAALTEDQFEELVARARPPKATRYPATRKTKRQNTSAEVNGGH
jgi:hypothetical protein